MPTTACSRIAHPRRRGIANGEAGRWGNEQKAMSQEEYIKLIYVVGSGLAAGEFATGFCLRRAIHAPARGFLILGCVQVFLLLLFRYGDTWFPQPPSGDLGGATFLQPLVVALDMLITVVALPSLVLWAAIGWIIKRRRTKGPNEVSEVTPRKLGEPRG